MVYNKIPVVFGALRTAVGPAVSYQYDVKQILVINGLDLPEYYEVDFCNKGDALTITMVGTANGVEIPDELLQTGKPIKAYIVIQGEDEGAVETRFEATLPVNTRPARSDIQPTPAEQTQIDTLISALNDGVERSEAAANDAESAKEGAESAVIGIDKYKEITDTLSGLFSYSTVAVTKRENGATHVLNQFFAIRAAAICGHYYNEADAALYVYGFFCCGDKMDHITYYRLDSRNGDAVELTPENAENVTELYSGTGRYYKAKGTAHLADGAHVDYRLCAIAYDANNVELYRLYSDQYRFTVESGSVTRERFDTAPRPSMDVTDFGYVRNTTSVPNTFCRVQNYTIRPIITTNQSSKFQWIVQDEAFDTEYGLSLAYRTGDGRVVSGPSFDKAEAGGDYDDMTNLPQINGVTLSGNMTATDLGLMGEDALATDEEVTAMLNTVFD